MKKIVTLVLLFISFQIFAQPVSNPTLWLRADSAVTMDVINNVSQWNDVSGNGYHVSQVDGGKQPNYQSTLLNGKPAIYFDGVSGERFLNNTTNNLDTAGTPRTVFVVGRMDCRAVANGPGSYPMEGGCILTLRRSAQNSVFALGKTVGNTYIWTDGVNGFSNATIDNGFVDTAKKPFLATYKHTGAGNFIQFRMNKNDVVVSQATSLTTETGITGFTVGNREDIVGQNWQGWISEIIFYDRLLTATEIQQVEDYLYNKYTLSTLQPLGGCGIKLWLKADEGVYNDAGITPATDGQAVQQWNDLSGNGYHLQQNTLAARPIFNEISTNGKPALQFNGAQMMRTLSQIYWGNTTSNDIFVVCKNTSPDAMLFESSPDVNTNNGSFYIIDNYTFLANGVSAALRGANGGIRIFKNTNGFIPCTKIYQVTNDMTLSGSSAIQIKLNNASMVDDNGYNSGTPSGGLINHYMYTGSRSDFTYGMIGNISEIIAFSSKLDAPSANEVYNYLYQKYFTGLGSNQFSALPNASIHSTNVLNDAIWKHTFNVANPSEIIASVKDNCLDLGARYDSVFVEATATLKEAAYMTMRRHFTIDQTINPVGSKQVRIYFSQSDFTDLQSKHIGLTAINQLGVIKYDGANEDGIFNSAVGSLTFIAPNQIITGSAFGQYYLEFTVSDFSEFWIYAPNVPLPLNWISFNAERSHNDVNLSWETAQEENVSHFEVERSINAIDFEKINSQTAKNKLNASYIYKDLTAHLLNTQKVYYRIKQVDIDRNYTYSKVVSVNFGKESSVQIFPNPAKNTVRIKGIENFHSVYVIGTLGTILNQLQSISPEVFDISHLPSGVYMLKLVGNSSTEVVRMVVK